MKGVVRTFLRGLSSGTVLTIRIQRWGRCTLLLFLGVLVQVGGVGTLCWVWCESWWREMRLLIMERLELRGIVGTWLAE